jgi:hypothetical protein
MKTKETLCLVFPDIFNAWKTFHELQESYIQKQRSLHPELKKVPYKKWEEHLKNQFKEESKFVQEVLNKTRNPHFEQIKNELFQLQDIQIEYYWNTRNRILNQISQQIKALSKAQAPKEKLLPLKFAYSLIAYFYSHEETIEEVENNEMLEQDDRYFSDPNDDIDIRRDVFDGDESLYRQWREE